VKNQLLGCLEKITALWAFSYLSQNHRREQTPVAGAARDQSGLSFEFTVIKPAHNFTF